MKYPLSCILILVVLFSCTSGDKKWLTWAKEADTASERLEYLNRIDFPLELEPADKALYGFLLTQTHTRLRESNAEDSLILYARDYYEKHPQEGYMPQVYELSADYYDWNKMYPQKLEMLQKGLNYSMEQKDSFLVSVFYTRTGIHHYTRREYHQALDNYQASLRYHTFANVYYMIGILMEQTGPPDSVDYYYSRSISFALEHGDTIPACHYLRNYAQFLAKKGLYNEAMDKLAQTEQLSEYYKGFPVSEMIKAEIFLKAGRLDSVQYHLDRAKDVRYKGSFGESGYIDLGTENHIASLQSVIDYVRYKTYDTSEIGQFNDSVVNDILFEKRLIAGKQEAQLRLERQHFHTLLRQQRINNLFVTGLLVCIILIGLILFWIRRRKEQLIEAEEQIDTLKNLLNDIRTDNVHPDDQSILFKKVLLQQLGIIRLVAASPTEQNKVLLKNISGLSGQPLPPDALLIWSDLYPVIDSLYERFHTRLVQKYGGLLTEKEIQLCCLLKAGFSTKEICVVTQQSTPSVYQRKTTIRKKLGMDEKQDIIEFISAPLRDL